MRTFAAHVAICLATLCLSACTASTPPAPGSLASGADLDLCVSEANRYRAMLNRTPLQRSATLDEYAATAAEYDGTRHNTHAYAASTQMSGGFVRFENEIPWWPLRDFGTVRTVIRQGIATMWAQGPGGPHYDSLTHPGIGTMGCGVYIGDGEVTVVLAFQ